MDWGRAKQQGRSTWRTILVLGLSSWVSVATPSRAAEQDGESNDEVAEQLDPNRWEPAAIPAINYDSDIGLGFGAIGTLARFEEGFDPYRARLKLLVFMAAKQDATGTIGIPFHDHAIVLDLPGLWDDGLRLNLRLAFGRYTNTAYYGIGMASEVRPFTDAELEDSEVARRYHTYEHTNPNGQLDGRFKLFEQSKRDGKGRLEALVGVSGGYHWVTPYEGSQLAQDVALAGTDSPDGQTLGELLHGTEDHGSLAINTGLLWDSRDHEFAPSRGTFTELTSQWSPGVDASLRYVRFYLGTSWYAPLLSDYLVVASRVAADALVGDPPVYGLSQFGVLTVAAGPGGAASLRGVPMGRYHGKIKTILNLELRGAFPWVDIFGERLRFGLVGFTDAGRVWSDWQARQVAGTDLDGPHAPFSVSLGGGARMQWAETFILRADFGYSPTNETTGFAIDIGHVF